MRSSFFLTFLVFTFLFCCKSIVGFTTDVSGVISSNTVWSLENSPYIVTDNVLVNSGVTLTIEVGVTIKFNKDKSLQINGELVAQGTTNDRIVFTSNEANPSIGDWGGINFGDTSIDASFDSSGDFINGSIINNCLIQYGGGNGQNGILYLEKSHPFISNSTISNSASSGIYANQVLTTTYEDTLNINNNRIYDNFGYGIYAKVYNYVGGLTSISNNVILNNGSYGVYITKWNVIQSVDTNPVEVINNVIHNNGGGVSFQYLPIKLKNNTISHNLNLGNGGGVYYSYEYASNNIITENLIIGNKSNSAGDGLFFSYIPGWGTGSLALMNNNFIENNIIDFYNELSYSPLAENNYWNTTSVSEIQAKIFDWNDDPNLGLVDYEPYLTTPNINAPISPPSNIKKNVSGSNIILTWTSNLESDVAGYKLHYGTPTGFSYANVVDLGNITTYTLQDGTLDIEYAITSYDNDIDGLNDQVEGNESWFGVALPPDTIEVNNVSCYLGIDGQIQIIQFNTVPPYKYSIDNGTTYFDTNTFLDLTAGEYHIVVKDGNGDLSHDEVVEIIQPPAYFEYVANSPSCFQGSDGSIELSILDGQPVTFNWYDNSSNLVKTDLQHGPYNLEATLGTCVSNIDIIIIEPDSLYSELRIENICSDGAKGKVTLTQKGGTGSATYSIDNGVTFQSNGFFSNLEVGEYTLLTKDEKGCESVSEIISIDQFQTPTPSLITGDLNLCSGEIAEFSTQEYDSYSWYKVGGNKLSTQPGMSTTEDGDYFVNISLNNCWANSDTVTVYNIQTYQNQPICVVTVDNATGNNKIEWGEATDKFVSDYNIYKETGTDIYSLIGSTAISTTGYYVDETSNPLQSSERYKLSITDECGIESNQSSVHKTIYLLVGVGLNNTVNLTWTNYEGFSYSQINILRGATFETMQLLTTRPANNNSFTDINPNAEEVLYLVEAIAGYECSTFTGGRIQEIAYTRSNIGNAKEIVSGIQDSFTPVGVYPNPTEQYLKIELDNPIVNGVIMIQDLQGKSIETIEFNGKEAIVQTINYKKGTYLITIVEGSKILKSSKFVVDN